MKTLDLEQYRWKLPPSYFGAQWPSYYVAAGRSRDSDALEESNFRVTLKRLGGEKDPAVIVVRESHWAVGWVEWIGVHENNKAGLAELRKIIEEKESYPILDEEDFSEEEESRGIEGGI